MFEIRLRTLLPFLEFPSNLYSGFFKILRQPSLQCSLASDDLFYILKIVINIVDVQVSIVIINHVVQRGLTSPPFPLK